MTTNHTPTPWAVSNFVEIVTEPKHLGMHGSTHIYIGTMRSSVAAKDRDTMEADAAFIVIACNAHDELVAALRDLVAEFDRSNRIRPDAEKLGDTPALGNARAALANVTQ